MGWLGGTRGLSVLLLLSLGVNLFLGGLLAGRIAGEAAHGSHTRRSIQAMLAALPAGKRDLVRREIDAAMPEVRRAFAALQKARAALAEQLARPSLDVAAVEHGFAEVQVHTDAIRAELQRAIVRALPALTDEERRGLAQVLARHRSGSALP